jgi:L-ascorbate metabolism protein UlaG (beta-lactamase superfamily)
MPEPTFYLKQNVKVEPLFNQWYAWAQLIAPASAAMNIANLHLKIMKSYVAAPQVHANAVKNPKMLGGPFIDYDGGRVEEIRELMERTVAEQAPMLRFAEAVKELDEMLQREAKGYSLEPLYPAVPPELRGYVELVYDLHNNPSIKFIEGMLYHSPYYDPSLQSLALSLINSDDRAFSLSTPRLRDEKTLHLKIPFNHKGVDELFRMKTEPKTLRYISELLRLTPNDQELFTTFLTEDPPQQSRRYDGEGVRLRYFGHATVLVETRHVSLLLDPVLSYKYENGIDRYTYLDLPESIDYVLITHAHQDHIMFETLLQLRHKIKNIILPRSKGGCLEDPSIRMLLQNIGFKNILELEDMETVEIPGGSITGVPFMGEHADCNIGSKIAHLVRLGGKSLLFAADSNNIEPVLYERLARILGDVDVLFIGMECDGAPMSWLYGPIMTIRVDRKMDQSRRFSGSDYERGIDIVNQLNFKEVYVYAMGQEPWLTYVSSVKYTDDSNPIVASNKLIEDCCGRSIVAERLYGTRELIY